MPIGENETTGRLCVGFRDSDTVGSPTYTVNCTVALYVGSSKLEQGEKSGVSIDYG